MTSQRGGFAVGLVVGLLVGLALALGVALYITKAPIPFLNKVPQRTAEQDSAETERNRNWDPNAPLAGKPVQRPVGAASAASGAQTSVSLQPAGPTLGARPVARDPAAILSGAAPPAPPPAPMVAAPGVPEPFIYFVQVGAFTRTEDAEQQRARLALIGLSAKTTEREQAGRTVYRVRLGPYPTRDDAEALQTRLQQSSIEAQIVRVEKP